MATAEQIKRQIRKAFQACINKANLELKNATQIKERIEKDIETLRLTINPMIDEFVENDKKSSKQLSEDDETVSICSEYSKYYELRELPEDFSIKSLLNKKRKLSIAHFTKLKLVRKVV